MKLPAIRNHRLLLPWYQIIWGTVLIALCVKTFLKPLSHSVFGVYYHAGLHWWQDESLYRAYPGIDYFRYSPLAGIFFSFFSLFGITLGGILWNLSSNAIYLSGCASFWNRIPQQHSTPNKNAFFIICLFGALSGIWNSQSNITVAGLLLLGLANLMESSDSRACLWLATALFLKITVAPVVCLILLLRPVALIRQLTPFLLLGFLLPFLTRPPVQVVFQYREWVNHLIYSQADRWPGFRDGWYLYLTWHQQFSGRPLDPEFWHESAATWYQVIQALGGLLAAWVVLYWKLRGMAPGELLVRTAALGMSWMMILGPAIEFPSYGLLAPFLAWACTREKSPRQALLRLGAFFILVMGWKEFQAPIAKTLPVVLASLPIGSILFTAWLVMDGVSLLNRRESHGEIIKTV